MVIADLNGHAAEATAAELGGRGTALGIGMDVTDEAQVEAGVAKAAEAFGRLDILVNNAGIQIVAPVHEFEFSKWKQLLAVHLDGAFLTTRAALRHMYRQGGGGSIVYIGSVHSKEASVLEVPYDDCEARAGGASAKVVAKEGAAHGCARTWSAPASSARRWSTSRSRSKRGSSGSGEEEVVRTVMLKDTVYGEFTTVEDVAKAVLFCAAFGSKALTGQSLVVSHGWFMQ